MTEDRHDEELDALLDRYNTPPPMPADSIWAGIEERTVADRRDAGQRRRIVHLPWTWAAAAAVVVFIGGAAAGARVMTEMAAGDEVSELSVSPPAEADLGVRHVVWF